MQMWAYANYSTLLDTGQGGGVAAGPYRASDYAGQQMWSVASAPTEGEIRSIHGKNYYWATLPDGVKTWIPTDAQTYYYADGSYDIKYRNPDSGATKYTTRIIIISTSKQDPNASGFWGLWGRNIISPWNMEGSAWWAYGTYAGWGLTAVGTAGLGIVYATGAGASVEITVMSSGNVIKLISRVGEWGWRMDPAHHAKPWGHIHWWRW